MEGVNKEENKGKNESILESKREATAQMFLGEKYKKLADIGVADLAKDIGGDFESYQRMKTYALEMNDVYVNEKEGIAAALLESRSWGGSGGIQWDKDLKIQMKDLRSGLQIFEARSRSNAKDDMPEFWYSKIKEVKYEDNCFKVQFEGDEKIWKLETGKEYFVSRGNNRNIEVHETERKMEYSVPGDKDRKIFNTSWECEKFEREMKEKYGPDFHWTTSFNYKESFNVNELRVNQD